MPKKQNIDQNPGNLACVLFLRFNLFTNSVTSFLRRKHLFIPSKVLISVVCNIKLVAQKDVLDITKGLGSCTLLGFMVVVMAFSACVWILVSQIISCLRWEKKKKEKIEISLRTLIPFFRPGSVYCVGIKYVMPFDICLKCRESLIFGYFQASYSEDKNKWLIGWPVTKQQQQQNLQKRERKKKRKVGVQYFWEKR